jgi:hypothetical protein
MNGLTRWVFTARKQMKGCRSCLSSYVLLTLVIVGANAALADAELVNFDSRFRVPGEYEIIFKKPSELQSLTSRYADPASGLKRPSVLANTLPLTKEALNSLAEALTKSINGKLLLGTVMESVSADDLPALFVVKGVSDETIKSLAKDPRIATIAASLATRSD